MTGSIASFGAGRLPCAHAGTARRTSNSATSLHLTFIMWPSFYTATHADRNRTPMRLSPRTGWGPLPVDHADSHASVESRARHEIGVCGFDHTQKIRVYGESPPPHPAFREQ